jgi:hypothetical protein
MQRKSGKSREEMTFQHVSSPFNTTIWSKKLKLKLNLNLNLNRQGEYREESLTVQWRCRNGLLDAKKVEEIERRNDFPARFITIQYHNLVKKIEVEFG